MNPTPEELRAESLYRLERLREAAGIAGGVDIEYYGSIPKIRIQHVSITPREAFWLGVGCGAVAALALFTLYVWVA